MTVIAVLSQKGGCGKTTIATTLAKGYQLQGKEVLLVDTDPQGSARDWAAANEQQTLPVAGLDRPTLERDIKPVMKDVDVVIIDGAPRHEAIMAAAVKVADVVLIPVQPSPYDVWATADLVSLLVQRQELLGTPKAAFILSRVIKRTRIGSEVREALDELRLPVLEGHTVQRVTYANAAAKGLTVLEVEPDGEAAAEIQAIMRDVDALLKGELKLKPVKEEGAVK
ncbi:ParA family partition ATPase [Ramlibacter alkalitolerans]|uniref:AAA family ATPase n=1 Tax=Ramlibacter alkalitolerans TaxID=2039631 RepID=A0ABS1JW82_9BURK|nr:ParA family partition ATPase [Ramlibacter alkalitolerans]MBL0427800.1 AAA family ATPase [Ramlibacter alkalitolerans]